jgi:hypothetical protein
MKGFGQTEGGGMNEPGSASRHLYEEMNRSSLRSRLAQGMSFLLSRLCPSLVAPVALLIDGDNISPDLIAPILAEAGKFGGVLIRRVYGNWSSPTMHSWKNVALHYALQPVHSSPIVAGKNAADIALVIDAMDLLHHDHIERFCLVTGDSDYTALVLRLRAAGCLVVGIGNPTTPTALMRACTVFVSTQQLLPAPSPSKSSPLAASPPPTERASSSSQASTIKERSLADLVTLLTEAYEEAVQGKQTEWVLISRLGVGLKKLAPDFQTKSYGYKDLSSLVLARTDLFENRRQNSKGKQLEVRLRKQV